MFLVILSANFLFLLHLITSAKANSQSPEDEEGHVFGHWLPQHVQSEGALLLLDRHALSEGEVLLFRTKKSRHRAIPVMSAGGIQQQQQQQSPHTQRHGMVASRFSDALTFKEWLRRVYQDNEDKALKVSVRTTEVVRPVFQHLYATRANFHAPIIVHANTFEGAGPSQEKPVDVVHFVESARQLLPDAVLSLGWTPSEDWAAVNRLDWAQAFQLLHLLRGLDRKQPVMLNMRLNDAVHSVEVLEWLLGVDHPAIYLLLHGDVGDFVDSDGPLRRLARLNSSNYGQRRRLLFDVDENWRSRIRRFVPEKGNKMEDENSIGLLDKSLWHNWLFSSSAQPLSTSVLSPTGVAFLGWPNSLLVSNRMPTQFPTRQTLHGRLMFLPKRQTREIIPQRRTGMVIYLFDQEPDLLFSPRVPNSIQAFIGFDGRISLENHQHHHQQQTSHQPPSKSPVLKRTTTSSGNRDVLYPKSSSAQLPKWPCYAFWLLDKGWRVEMEVWTEKCSTEEERELKNGQKRSTNGNGPNDDGWISQRTFLQLDTPIARSRRSRNVAIGKSGDGAIDFLARGLQHNNGSAGAGDSFSILAGLSRWPFLLILLLAMFTIVAVILPSLIHC